MSSRALPYARAADVLIRESGVVIRRWRSGNTGTAATSDKDWEIEAPQPRGPVSFGVFAHEVAHQTLHRRNSKPRWREEVEAEEWALAQFDRFDLAGRERYERHAALHVGRTFLKAIRRSRRERGALAREILIAYPEWWERAEREHARKNEIVARPFFEASRG